MNDERWKNDGQFEAKAIRKVDEGSGSWIMTFADGWSLGLAKSYGVTPVAGKWARLYGDGIGRPVRGVVIDGQVAYYRDEDEEKAKHAADVAERHRKQREEFEAKRADNDARIAALPAEFRARFDRFRANNPDHRWKFEGYELFCCEEAVRLAAHAVNAPNGTSSVEWLRAFSKAPMDTQRKLAPDMKLGDHSGNTFGFSCQLAHAYLERPDIVPLMHGALANLVGCEEYGCPPTTQG